MDGPPLSLSTRAGPKPDFPSPLHHGVDGSLVWVQGAATEAEELQPRIRTTLDLLGRRGYGVTPERLAALLHGGPVDPDCLHGLAATHLRHGRLAPPAVDTLESLRRQESHEAVAAAWWGEAAALIQRLANACPWLEVALVSGSLASGGFVEGDDIDLSLVCANDTKYLTYLMALLWGLPLSWRLRHRLPRDTPILPKAVCVNVVWESSQARPFARQDVDLAFELLLSRPVVGHAAYQSILEANAGLLAHFPQLLREEVGPRVAARSNLRHRVLATLTRPRALRRALNGAAYAMVRLLHAWVRWHRRKDPGARSHAERMEAFKHPYATLDHPRRQAA